MHVGSPIFLAASEGVGLDVVVWLIAGAIWLFSQMAAAKKKQQQKGRPAQSPDSSPIGPRAGAGDAPTPNELAEIFKRLGADIPATPPPPPRPPPAPRPARTTASASANRMAHKSAPRLVVRKPAAPPIPAELAQRLARVRKEAEAAGREAEAERIAINAIVHGVQSRSGESRAFDTATRHTGMILPRLYAMSMRMAPWPTMPMPGFDPSHHVGKPFRSRLHTRREVRDALIAQTFLHPPKSFTT